MNRTQFIGRSLAGLIGLAPLPRLMDKIAAWWAEASQPFNPPIAPLKWRHYSEVFLHSNGKEYRLECDYQADDEIGHQGLPIRIWELKNGRWNWGFFPGRLAPLEVKRKTKVTMIDNVSIIRQGAIYAGEPGKVGIIGDMSAFRGSPDGWG